MGRDLATSLAFARVVLGVGTWLAPTTTLALTSLDPTAAQSPYLLRLFAAREAALGCITLLLPGERRALLALGLAVDCLDTAAGLSALRRRSIGRAAAALAGVAAGSVAVGSVALVRARRQTP